MIFLKQDVLYVEVPPEDRKACPTLRLLVAPTLRQMLFMLLHNALLEGHLG